MSYQVHITSTAEHDIMRAADYIEFTLKNPNAADKMCIRDSLYGAERGINTFQIIKERR